MKTIYFALCFTCFGLGMQAAPSAATNDYGQALRDALHRAMLQGTNSPARIIPSAPSLPIDESSPTIPAKPSVRAPVVAQPKAVIPPPATAHPIVAAKNNAEIPSAPPMSMPAVANAVPEPSAGVKTTIANKAAVTRSATNASDEEMLPPGMINFSAVDLNQVLDIYAELVNRTVLRPANLPAPLITLKTQTPLTKREAIQALDAVLGLNGIAMIDVSDKFVKAVPIAQANQEGAPFNKTSAANLPDLGQYVTHVVQLQYVKPSELVPALQPFAKAPNAILAIDSSQILVLRDYTENVKRMLQMVDQIDVAVPSEFVSEVIPIKYALAEDIASALGSLGGSTAAAIGGSSGRTGSPGTGRPGFGNTLGGSTPGAPTTTPGAQGAQTSFTQRLQSIMRHAGVGSGSGDIQLLGPTKIIADQRSNALLVFASREDMATIKDIVSKLDVLLPQVLIESVIMDVALNNGWSLGVSAVQNPQTFSPSLPAIGGGGYNNGQPFANFLTNAVSFIGTNIASGLPGGYLSYFANIGPNWDVALQAAANNNNVTIIQRPRIQTSQAKEAQFFVGQTVPYVSQVYYSGLGTGPSSSFQQLQVGIQLDVTPFINPNGLVVMDINQEIDDLNGTTHIDGVGDVPNTVKRSLSSEIAVRDRDTIILGGFIRSQNQKTKSGVPLLQDIPILGSLFSSRTSSKAREELMVLMRPTVLRTPEVAAAQVAEEVHKLPGIHRAAVEDQMYEREQSKKEETQLRKEMAKEKGNSFQEMTPEEIRAYGNTNLPPQSFP